MRIHYNGFASLVVIAACLLAAPSRAAEKEAGTPYSGGTSTERSVLNSATQQAIARSAVKIIELGEYPELRDALRARVRGMDHIILARCKAIPEHSGSFDVVDNRDKQQVVVVTKDGIELWAQWRELSSWNRDDTGRSKPIYVNKHQRLRNIRSAAELEQILAEAGTDTSVDAIEDSFQHAVMSLLQ